MPKIVVETGMVFNLGGYIVERTIDMPCIDFVIGNPLKHYIKVDAPIYSMETIEQYKKQGLIVEYVNEGDFLKDKLQQVKARVDEALDENTKEEPNK